MEQTDLVLPCSKTYRLDEKFVDTAKNQPLKVSRCVRVRGAHREPVEALAALLRRVLVPSDAVDADRRCAPGRLVEELNLSLGCKKGIQP